MVADIMKMEKAAELLPRVIEHMEWMTQTVHQAYHGIDATDPAMGTTWRECPNAFCKSTMIIIKSSAQ
jgi:hypothetical protein